MRMPIIYLLLIYPLSSLHASDLDDSIQIQKNTQSIAIQSQKRIDKLSTENTTLLTEYRLTLQKTEATKTYNAQIKKLLKAQQQELLSLNQQLTNIDQTERDILPLMLRMLDTLEKFIQLGAPFSLTERRLRVSNLHNLMNRADVTIAEKYRRLLEAFLIEMQYANTIEAYEAPLPNSTQQPPPIVNFLRIGRLMLYYQTLDSSQIAYWDQLTNKWHSLPDKHQAAIKRGFRVARKQTAPEFLRLPLPSPKTIQLLP
jgi:hypothetical protein